MLYIEVQQQNLKLIVDKLTKSKRRQVRQQQSSLSQLQPIIEYFCQQYFCHFPHSVILDNINKFFTKLFNRIVSIDLMRNIYEELSIQVRKLTRYQAYVKQLEQIDSEENYQECQHNRKSNDMQVNLQEINASAFKIIRNQQKETEYIPQYQNRTTNLTLNQDIESLPEFNFYESIKNNKQGQLFEEWTDQFIQKKLQVVKLYKSTHHESFNKASPNQSLSTSKTKNQNQLGFHKSLSLIVQSGTIEQPEQKNNSQKNDEKKQFIYSDTQKANLEKNDCFNDSSNRQLNQLKDQMITEWDIRPTHIFVVENHSSVIEMVQKQQQIAVKRAQQLQNLQQRKTMNQKSYCQILKKLKQQAKMKIIFKKYRK